MTHRMYVLNHLGDTAVVWEVEKEEEVDAAATVFLDYKRKGHAAFAGPATETPVLIQEFDPTAEEIVMVPPIVGG